MGKERDLPVLAYMIDGQTAAVDHVHKREGLQMAPAYAMPTMLDQAVVGLGETDYYEIHEAFAAQVLCTLKAWEDAEFCKEKLGRDKPLGSNPARQAQRQRRPPRLPAVRRHRRADRGRPRQRRHEDGKGRGVISIGAAAAMVRAVLESAGGAS